MFFWKLTCILKTMLDPLDYENRPYLDKLARKRRAAFLSLSIEKIALHFWRPVFWCLFFCGLWMLELPDILANWGVYGTLIFFVMGLVYLIRTDVFTLHKPDKSRIDRAIEEQSRILRGEIQSIEDDLANPKKHETRALWHDFQQYILKQFAKLKAPWPRAVITRQDPYGLRFLAILMFVTGAVFAGPEWQYRISKSLFPFAPVLWSKEVQQDIHVWITPPEYTSLPQIQIQGGGRLEEAVSIPEGSRIKIRVRAHYGEWFAPYMIENGKHVALPSLGDEYYGLDKTIETGNELRIKQFYRTLALWPYEYKKDQPPMIKIAGPDKPEVEVVENQEQVKVEEETGKEEMVEKVAYEVLPNSHVRFALELFDDYSVTDLEMLMTLDEMVEEAPLGEGFSETRLVMSPPEIEFRIDPLYDLTWHSWAGLPVVIIFKAKDHNGQYAALEPIKLVLPEREFEHPVAKSLITVRKTLAWQYEDDFSKLAADIATLLRAPDFFGHNPVVFLAIKTASARLAFVNHKDQVLRTEAARAVIKLLWDTAITVEDGDLALALRELRQAQRDLAEALRDPNTTQEELNELTDALREKMAQYFMELQREMQKRMAEGQDIPTLSEEEMQNAISPDNLSKFMDELQSHLQNGDTKSAQEMLSQLQRMMEMMDPSMMQNMPSDMQMMQKGINELDELIKRQEALLEQTEKQEDLHELMERQKAFLDEQQERQKDQNQAQNQDSQTGETQNPFNIDGFPPAPDFSTPAPDMEGLEESLSADTTANEAEQEALRYILGQLMMAAAEKIDEVPESLGKAEQEMRGSSNALSENDPTTSIPHQEKAIEYLKEGQEQLAQQLKQRMQQMIGFGMSGGGSGQYDPLGRPYGGEEDENGNAHGSPVKIPDEAERKRIEEILKMLRERSGELDRPSAEREYYRRLLRQF